MVKIFDAVKSTEFYEFSLRSSISNFIVYFPAIDFLRAYILSFSKNSFDLFF